MILQKCVIMVNNLTSYCDKLGVIKEFYQIKLFKIQLLPFNTSGNMYNIRKRNLRHPERQINVMDLEISAKHEDLPTIGENWNERRCTLPNGFSEFYDKVWNLKLRNDDVFVVTFMKAGTTWTQEAVWLLMNNLDFTLAKEKHMGERTQFLEFKGLLSSARDSVEDCNNMQSPRLINTHLPVNLLPKEIWKKKTKIVYVARNLKDVIVSAYHFVKGLGWWTGNINEFVEDFLNNDIMYTPFWPHVNDYWKIRNESNICFLTYEDMKRDLASVLQKLCRFLERPELTSEELKAALEHLSFESMKNNNSTNLTEVLKKKITTVKEDFEFMRRGEVSSYKDELTYECSQRINDATQSFLSKHGIKEEDIFGSI